MSGGRDSGRPGEGAESGASITRETTPTAANSAAHVWDSHKHDAELHERIRELEEEVELLKAQKHVLIAWLQAWVPSVAWEEGIRNQ